MGEREQLLFKSTDFGDDKDRALQKSDSTWTYFASDVIYHKNKLDRKFDYLINILEQIMQDILNEYPHLSMPYQIQRETYL